MKKDDKRGTAILDDQTIIDLYWKRDEKAIDATDKKYRKLYRCML